MIQKEFYLKDDVIQIAKDLLGKELLTNFDGKICSGYIVETEAYAGITDKASHAYGGKFTKRTQTMYLEGGTCYVYLCYGIHSLFNIVTNVSGIPHAVLIRAVQPLKGIDTMFERRPQSKNVRNLANGPGSLSKALGISTFHNELKMSSNQIWLEEGLNIKKKQIIASPRVGVAYAKEDALLPYRFRIKDNPFCSLAK
ncbi:MAG: DNA-3-methyladenine glycosylase [Bacteroidia bacterium]